MSSVLTRNARLVNEGREFEGDLLVSHRSGHHRQRPRTAHLV
jgi:hypothetical protein